MTLYACEIIWPPGGDFPGLKAAWAAPALLPFVASPDDPACALLLAPGTGPPPCYLAIHPARLQQDHRDMASGLTGPWGAGPLHFLLSGVHNFMP